MPIAVAGSPSADIEKPNASRALSMSGSSRAIHGKRRLGEVGVFGAIEDVEHRTRMAPAHVDRFAAAASCSSANARADSSIR